MPFTLDSYLAEVRRHPLLTREEELSLARRVRRDGDRAARIRLVSSHLRLVVKMAREHLRPPLVMMDLTQDEPSSHLPVLISGTPAARPA